MAIAGDERSDPTPTPARWNNRIWRRGSFLSVYNTRELRAVEVMILVRYRDDFGDRLLELGCGAGRLTSYLAELVPEVEAIELSPRMVAAAQRNVPRARIAEGDMRDLSRYADGSFSTVVAGWNVLDVLDDRERRLVLDEIHRVLAPEGLFVLSSHNRAYLPNLSKPTRVRTQDPARFLVDLTRIPGRLRRHRELAPRERHEPEYAIVNDEAHQWRFLHYFISRDAQERQLGEHGFELLEALDRDGHVVAPHGDASDHIDLHYLARRR